MGRGGEHFASGLAFLYHYVHCVRDVEFLLEFLAIGLEEVLEDLLSLREEIRGEAPHVHGAEILAVEGDMLACHGVVSGHFAVGSLDDVEMLDHIGKMLLAVVVADASGHPA